jgi:hypothetical protein
VSAEPVRALWLLDHRAARRSDVRMLVAAGVDGVFAPGSRPWGSGFQGGVAAEEPNAPARLPADELAVLNATDWNREVSDGTWDLINRRFSILAFRPGDPVAFRQILRRFGGTVVLRALGVGGGRSYSDVVQTMTDGRALAAIEALGERFVFGQAYDGLSELEHAIVADRRAFLPLCLPASPAVPVGDERTDERVVFACPDINVHPRRRDSYLQFVWHFRGLPHVVVGRQPVAVPDPNVAGWLPQPEFDGLMRRCRVLFYEHRDPLQLDDHPLAAMRAGVPVVYLSGGLLERLAGLHRAGCADSWETACRLVHRLVRGDRGLADTIVAAQRAIVGQFDESFAVPHWRQAVAERMLVERSRVPSARLQACDAERRRRRHPLKIAVFLPESHLAEHRTAARRIASAIARAGSEAGREVRIVLAPPEQSGAADPRTWEGLGLLGEVRPTRWSDVAPQVVATMASLLRRNWRPDCGWTLPTDGRDHYMDCDAWIVVGDRVGGPILNVRPVVMAVFDCLQRYVAGMADRPAWNLARILADRIVVTSEEAKVDLIQLGSIPGSRIMVLPSLLPESGGIEMRPGARPEAGYWKLVEDLA